MSKPKYNKILSLEEDDFGYCTYFGGWNQHEECSECDIFHFEYCHMCLLLHGYEESIDDIVKSARVTAKSSQKITEILQEMNQSLTTVEEKMAITRDKK